MIHRHLSEVESKGERFSPLGSKTGRPRAIYRIVLNDGMRLDRESVKTNAAKRDLAILCLNSMWEKLT